MRRGSPRSEKRILDSGQGHLRLKPDNINHSLCKLVTHYYILSSCFTVSSTSQKWLQLSLNFLWTDNHRHRTISLTNECRRSTLQMILCSSGNVGQGDKRNGVKWDLSSSLEMELGGQDWEPVHWWEKREGKRQTVLMSATFPTIHLSLAFTVHTHSMTDSLVKILVLLCSNFLVLHCATLMGTFTMVSVMLREIVWGKL